jgi:hypothetical protein
MSQWKALLLALWNTDRRLKHSKEILVEFEQDYPNTLKGENISGIIERAKQKRAAAQGKDDSG